MFTDSIDGNLDLLRMLLQDMAPGRQQEARRAFTVIEKAFRGLQADNPKNNAVALGCAIAIFTIASRLVGEVDDGVKNQPLIQLLG